MKPRSLIAAAVAGLLASLLGAVTPAQARTNPPTGLKAVSSTETTMKFDWNDVAGAPKYAVNYSTNSTFAGGGASKSSVASAITLAGLKPKTRYYVRVKVISATWKPYSDWSATAAGTTRTPPADLIVGSFNLKNPNSSSVRPWSERLPVIVRDITEEWLDVLGIQEIYNEGDRQEVLDALSAADRPYAMFPLPVEDDLGEDNRILYRSSKVAFVKGGTLEYSKQEAGETKRWMVWAQFKHKANNRGFFFATTHLQPGNDYVDKKQWEQLIAEVEKRNVPKYPVIVVGDFNTSKFQVPADSMLTAMYKKGYGDVLGQTYRSYTPSKQRAVQKIDVNINSSNGYDPVLANHMVSSGRVGNNVDWIFAWNSLPVTRWRTVIHQSGGRLISPIPSDHNLVTARLKLP